MCSIVVDKFVVEGKEKFKMNKAGLQQITNRTHPLKLRYLGSFTSDYVSTLPNDTVFAFINAQPSNMQGEHWILIANFSPECFLETLSDVKSIISSNSITKRRSETLYSPIPAFVVSTRLMQLSFSSKSDT